MKKIRIEWYNLEEYPPIWKGGDWIDATTKSTKDLLSWVVSGNKKFPNIRHVLMVKE